MATPKKGGFGLVGDFRVENQRVEKVTGVMPNQEPSMAKPSEAKIYSSLDLLQGYRQCPLAPHVKDIFTIATPGGLYTPTHVPQKKMNSTCYFQETLTRVLEGLNSMIWVGAVIYCGLDETDLLNTLGLILGALRRGRIVRCRS